MQSLTEFYKKITVEKTFRRLITALFFSCGLMLVFNKGDSDFMSFEYMASVDLKLHIAVIFLIFALLTVLFSIFEQAKTEKLILFSSFMFYALLCVPACDNMYFTFAVCCVLFAVCKYCFSDMQASIPFGKGALITASALSIAFFALFVGLQTSFRVLTQSTPCFDFGIFSQMYYYMKETLIPYTTCERAVLLSHFDIHVSPIYYLFLPIYAIFPHPVTLQVCQALLLASGVIPLVLLCRRLALSRRASALFAIAYAFYPCVAGGCYYDLHENKFLLPLLLWLFFSIEKNKWWAVMTFGALTLLVKEDAPVYVAFAAIYMLISKKDIKKGLVLLATSLVYFLIVVSYLENYGYSGIMSYRYNNFIYEEGGGLLTVIKSVIISPANVFNEIFDVTSDVSGSKIIFMLQTLAPLGFLPFITKKYHRFVLLGPYILVNLMPDYVYQHNIYFQYTYGSAAFLLYLAVMNFSELSYAFKRTFAVFAASGAILFFSATVAQKPNYIENYSISRENHEYVSKVLADIPENASVASNTMYVTGASQRRVIYSMDDNNYKNDPIHTEYLVFDLRYSSNRKLYSDKYAKDPSYELVAYRENWIAVIRCKTCAEGSVHE